MKKGFTLIELLAVIVILAIIALIATPIVLGIINDAKESSTLRSADFYIDALENQITLENMKLGGTLNPKVCTISNSTVLCDDKEITLEVDGEVPTSGSITFEDGHVTGVTLEYASGKVTMNSKGELAFGEVIQLCKLISDVAPTGISAGDKYQCKVKDEMETGFENGYYFYVLSKEEDGTTNLIMDRNINSDGTVATKGIYEDNKENGIYNLIEWISRSDYELAGGSNWTKWADNTIFGPITAMKFLNNATSTWNNISNLNITGRARLPYYREVSATGCMQYEAGSCPMWIASYLDDDGNDYQEQGKSIAEMEGYWLFDAVDGYEAERVHYTGSLFSDSVSIEHVDYEYNSGIRPVINVKL